MIHLPYQNQLKDWRILSSKGGVECAKVMKIFMTFTILTQACNEVGR